MNQKEKLFYDKLKDIFIGEKIEGKSGFANLMRMKSAYFDEVFEELDEEIKDKTEDFPDFREELYNKLYTFLKRYFTDSGSILYRRTTPDSKIYEKVYDNEKDVSLFWKTNMLYYVKTEKLWKPMTIDDYEKEGEEYEVEFDVSELEGKRGNVKKGIIFDLGSADENKVVFNVKRPSHGRKTKVKEIRRELNSKGIPFDREDLEHLFKTYKKQNEVDFFINKDAEQFLKEQFDLWLKHYVMDDETVFEENRLKKLKILRDIAYKIIDFVSQFEDELVKIWNKPKFVLNSNYVITLDRIAERGGQKTIEHISKDEGFEEQVEEWKKLGILDSFDESALFTNTSNSKELNEEYQTLPIDTKYFKEDLKSKILSLFDHLDEQLDGQLIHSDNYQALNTVLPKYRRDIQTIYIDPPFKTGVDFFYKDNFQTSSWLSLMRDRLEISKFYLRENGNLFVHLDWNANYLGRYLLESLFSEIGEIVWNTNATKDMESGLFSYKSFGDKFVRQHDTIFKCSMISNSKFRKLWRPNRRTTNLPIGWLDIISKSEEKNPQGLDDYEFFIEKYNKDGKFEIENINLDEKVYPIGDIWNDIYSFTQSELRVSENVSFDTQKPENLLRRIIQSTTERNDIVMDPFVGSGTTVGVAHKLNRRWVGIEVSNAFNEFYNDGEEKKLGLLGRMKIILSGDKKFKALDKDRRSHLSKDINWQGGGFFKYYSLEQYEQTLKNCVYESSEPFTETEEPTYDQYVFMKDEKMLDAVELDFEEEGENVDFSNLYSNVDLAETLSNLKGKKIKEVTENSVTFEDGEKIEYDDIDFETIKPLIWW